MENGRDGRPADGNRWCGLTRQVPPRASVVKVPPDCGPAVVKLRVENFLLDEECDFCVLPEE